MKKIEIICNPEAIQDWSSGDSGPIILKTLNNIIKGLNGMQDKLIDIDERVKRLEEAK